MLWICRDCGNGVFAANALLVTTMGWTALDGDTGMCPICSRPQEAADAGFFARSAAIRLERANRAIAVSRTLVERSRRPRWDEPLVVDAADRLGFDRVPCPACNGRGDLDCPNCEGHGDVWRSGVTTMARSGLLRLAMWPGKPPKH
jgi:hypothetical protein